eukprot:995572-Rhodomonas_salina.1
MAPLPSDLILLFLHHDLISVSESPSGTSDGRTPSPSRTRRGGGSDSEGERGPGFKLGPACQWARCQRPLARDQGDSPVTKGDSPLFVKFLPPFLVGV